MKTTFKQNTEALCAMHPDQLQATQKVSWWIAMVWDHRVNVLKALTNMPKMPP